MAQRFQVTQRFQVAHIVRYCSDCSADRPYEQIHDQPGECPDGPDGDCVEWSCTDCGAALLIGVSWPSAQTLSFQRLSSQPAPPAVLRGRVA